ncbi:MAG: DUF2157 domain-containing protein [Leptospiraceae bacterium]|nr:DUF2157 domain-containing protein [Leptospiraceae bacterium]
MNSGNQKADSNWLRGLVREGFLESQNFQKSEKLAGLNPASHDWVHFINYYLLSLGAGLFIVGVIFFFAYNWKDLHKFAKLGIVQFLFLSFFSIAFIKGRESAVGKISLFLSSVVIGIYFAVFGQIYQTGADAYELFLIWTILVTVFAVLGKDENLLFFWVFLINLTLTLFWSQRIQPSYDSDIRLIELLFVLNVVSFAFWEYSFNKKKFAISRRWASVIFALASIFCISIATLAFILENPERMDGIYRGYYYAAPVIYLAFFVALFYYIIFISPDLFLAAMSFLSFIVIITVGISKFMKLDSHDFLFLSAFVMTEAAISVVLLKKIHSYSNSGQK